jgi:hypothetical protein
MFVFVFLCCVVLSCVGRGLATGLPLPFKEFYQVSKIKVHKPQKRRARFTKNRRATRKGKEEERHCYISGSFGGEYEVTVFWDIAPCVLVELYRRFRGSYCPHH